MAEQRVPTVAVIGSGAAGLGAAWLLSRARYNVHLFESSSKVGGHAHTVDLPLPGSGNGPPMTIPVDTGFIVYNTRTYPDLVSLFELLGVEEENSSMSFASSIMLPSSGNMFEWGSDSLTSLFADRKNLYRPAMYTMLYDVNRFNTAVYDFVSAVDNDPTFKDRDMTLRQFLNKGAYSSVFVRAYLVPMVSAVWSASFNSALQFPARSLFHFFVNHGLAQVFNRPQWRTPAKRSRDYVNRLIGDFKAHGGTVHVSAKVTAATRNERYCTVQVNHADRPMRFDHLVFATHAPDTLGILGDDVTDDERRILSQFEYSTNNAFVHHDERLMPANKAVWSSWNFIGQRPGMSSSSTNSSDEKTATAAASSMSLSDDSVSTDISTDTTSEVKKANEKASEVSAETSSPSPDNDNKNGTKTNEKSSGGEEGVETSDEDPVCVSYWLNRLQNYHKYHLPVPDLFITLNPVIPIRPDKILLRLSYDHPQFTEAAVNAQPELQKVIQGKNRTWFCGAYTRFGFHEDAMMSGLDVAEKLTGHTTIRPWRMKNCMAINDHSRQYDFPLTPAGSGISSRFGQFMFLAGLLVINAVIARLQIGLGKIAARMTDHHPVVLVASGEGRLHRFGPKHVRRRRTNSFFTFSQMLTQPPQSASSSSSSLPCPLPPPPPSASLSSFVADGSTTIQPSAARLTVRNPTVLARIADALRHGSELAPIAAAAFAAGEFDCPSPTDLSETLRSLFIAHGLDDPSKARKGRAKLAENLLSSIVGKFDHVRAISAHTRLPELTTCMLNVLSPSWWLELDQTCSGDSDINDVQLQKQQQQQQPPQQQPHMSSFKSMVSPHDLKDVSSILELGGDLSELTVAMLQSSPCRQATVAVQTAERIEFVKCKAELLLVAEQVNVMLLSELRNRRETGFGLSDELDKDDDDMKFDLIFSPGTINNYRCCGFKSAKQVLEFIQSFCVTNAVVELGVVVYGNRQKPSADEKKSLSKNAIFSSDDGYRLWEISDVMQLSSNMKRLDLQRVAFLDEEEAAVDIHEVIQRVYNSLAIDKLEPKETRLVLAQMCLWQAALGVKYLRRMAVSFTYR